MAWRQDSVENNRPCNLLLPSLLLLSRHSSYGRRRIITVCHTVISQTMRQFGSRKPIGSRATPSPRHLQTDARSPPPAMLIMYIA